MDWIVELATESEVRSFNPDFEQIASLGMRGLQVTAKADSEFDFVSRFFAPQSGVDEDPVTGSAHCCLGPYWGAKLGKDKVTGYQASDRGGVVTVELFGERVGLLGDAVMTLEGVLHC
jgi:predicted PhzF superfamily epimerase YddE/YHI9